MARNGSGTYNRIAGTPYVYNTVIDQAVVNSEMDDIATALTASIAKDGQTTPTADLPMGSYKHTGVGAASARTHYTRAAEVQDGTLTYLTSVAGADTITATAALSMSAYSAGQQFSFISAGANTGAVTLNINSIGAKSVTKHGATALAVNEIISGAVVVVEYDGTRFQLVGASNDALLHAATAKTTPVDADEIGIWDSVTGTLKKVPFSSIAKLNGGTNSDIARMEGAGNGVCFGGPPTSRNNCSLQTANSIGFPATQIASADPNALDDYEEGTFTPVITFATPGDLSVAYTTQVGEYTKIGQDVRVSVNILTSTFTHTTASGNLHITGHPFTSKNVSGQASFGSTSWQGITKTNYTQINVALSANNTVATLNGSGSGQPISSVSTGDMPTGGTVSVRYTMTYPSA